jgi:simple sugar transport system ATP-binding protein
MARAVHTRVGEGTAPAERRAGAVGLQALGMRKSFGPLLALDDVSLEVAAGSFHALLGENGAGKSTLVKCIMGFHHPDAGRLLVDGREVRAEGPREAHAAGIGMVYQHFTLVPSLTAAENLVLARDDAPTIIDWKREKARLEAFVERMPFRVPLDAPVWTLAAGEKQKLEILKQLYLNLRFLILDEPTSVLTPAEADEVLGLVHDLTRRGEVTALMITHKFREVQAFADTVTVLRNGRVAGSGAVSELSVKEMISMMVGQTELPPRSQRVEHRERPVALELQGVGADDDDGSPALRGIDLRLRAGEIVGIAGVSGNGQSALVEVLTGQRALRAGRLLVDGEPYLPERGAMARHRVFGLPEDPRANAAVASMSVAENIAFRTFDRPPIATLGWWLSRGPMRRQARELIGRYRVKTPSTETPIGHLSGGNIQRTVLSRELSGDVGVLIVANPCAGLDFASVAETRARIMEQRNAGAAVLLVSEDLDEVLELADRVAVMFGGRITHVADVARTDRATIGHFMAGRPG